MQTYVPPFPENLTLEDLVLDELEARMLHHGVHTIYKGHNIRHGRETGDMSVTCVVEEKGVHAQNQLPPWVVINGQKVLLDVIEDSKKVPAICKLPDFSPQAENIWQKCYDCPVPGAVQIGPEGKDWVGSAGAAVRVKGADGQYWYGVITNNHVAGGVQAIGKKLCQPHGRSGWVGVFKIVIPIRFDGQPNYVDVAVADTFRSDGPYAPGTHTVVPRQLTFGKINPNPKDAAIGDKAKQEARTIGATFGKVVGVNGRSHVGYDEGTGLYRGQDVFEAPEGRFSAGGHSGSIIFSEDMRPMSLLFAGGGRQTIGNPIRYVMDAAGIEFF